MRRIYLDNAATTEPSKEVILAMNKANKEYWGNPSSVHSVGQEAKHSLDESRRTVAKFLNCQFDEVIFTSGGSESDNLAIRGIAESLKLKAESKPHIITGATEHHAVLHTVQELEKEGKIEATYLKPGSDGIISAKSVEDAIKDNTILVSIMYANNETGVINPVQEIAEAISGWQNAECRMQNDGGQQTANRQRIFFHTDAVQATEWMEMDVEKLGVDLLTFTGHKIHGPKGIGVLFVKKGTPIRPQITGGGHEFNKRAGTENIASIAGLAAAITELKAESGKQKAVAKLRDKLENSLLKSIPNSILNGSKIKRAPHITNISFINAEGEAIILNLDFLGIAVSSGSACTSRSLEPSHVLTAMGIPPEKAHGSIRFSLSRNTTEEEINTVLKALPPIIEKLRAMSPFK